MCGNCRVCEQCQKYIDKKVIATQKFNSCHFQEQTRKSPPPPCTHCMFSVCSTCYSAHIKTMGDFVPDIMHLVFVLNLSSYSELQANVPACHHTSTLCWQNSLYERWFSWRGSILCVSVSNNTHRTLLVIIYCQAAGFDLVYRSSWGQLYSNMNINGN